MAILVSFHIGQPNIIHYLHYSLFTRWCLVVMKHLIIDILRFDTENLFGAAEGSKVKCLQ
jgi:hypothetical protein